MNDYEQREIDRYKEKRTHIDSVISGLSNAEKSELSRRMSEVQHARARQLDLIALNNALQKNRELELKNKDKNTLIGVGVFLFALAVNALMGSVIDDRFAVFALVIFVYISLKYNIADTEYVVQYRLFDFEIKRLDADTQRYGILFSLDDVVRTVDVSTASDAIKNKYRFDRQKAYCDLEEQVLISMSVLSPKLL